MIYPRSVRASQGRQQQQTLFLVIEKIGGGSSSSSNILWTFYDKTKPVEMDLLECNNRGTPFKRLWFRGCRDGVDSWEAGVGGWGKARPHHSQNKKKKGVELDPVYTENAATRKKRLLQAGMEGYGSWVGLHPKRHWHGLFCDCCTHGVLGHVTATPRRKMRQPSLICPFSLHVNIPAFSHVVAGGEFWALVTTAWQGISVARAS